MVGEGAGLYYPAHQFPVNGDAIHLTSLHSLSPYLKYLTFLWVGELVQQHSCSIYADCGLTSKGSPALLPLRSLSNLAQLWVFTAYAGNSPAASAICLHTSLPSLSSLRCALGRYSSYGYSFIPWWAPPISCPRCWGRKSQSCETTQTSDPGSPHPTPCGEMRFYIWKVEEGPAELMIKEEEAGSGCIYLW